jgi:hypothetical protein
MTKQQILSYVHAIELIATKLESAINTMFDDGIIMENDDPQIIALKSKLERKKMEIESTKRLIQRLKISAQRKRAIDSKRKNAS